MTRNCHPIDMSQKRQNTSTKGQAIAEYLLLTALIAIASISVLQVLSSNVRRKIATVSNAIMGQSDSSPKGIKAQKKHYEIIDMNSFEEAIVNNEN